MLDNLNRENKKEQVDNSNSDVEARVIQPNSFINGDCMEFMRTCPPNFFDLAIVDPPYGIDVHKQSKFGNRIDNKVWDASPPDEYFELLKRVSKNQIIWGGNYFDLPKTRCWLIWDKQNGTNDMADAELAWTSFTTSVRMYRGHIFKGIGNMNYKPIHPTQKPVDLYRWTLKKYAKAGDLILDTHVGSASSLIACTELGFDYVGFEIDKEYYTMAKSRLGRATRKYELFEAV